MVLCRDTALLMPPKPYQAILPPPRAGGGLFKKPTVKKAKILSCLPVNRVERCFRKKDGNLEGKLLAWKSAAKQRLLAWKDAPAAAQAIRKQGRRHSLKAVA